MPELPEVETVKNGLTPYMHNKDISQIDIFRFDMRITAPSNSTQIITNQKVTSLSRRSKYLYIHLSNGHTLIVHLGMSGSLTMHKKGTEPRKHDHFILYINDIQIHFNDPRRFGFFDVQKTESLPQLKYIQNLGMEPLDPQFTVDTLYNIMRNRVKPIKNLLMDNAHIVGIGNIYACEALFKASISPLKPAKSIDIKGVQRLHHAIQSTLTDAIKSGGSSLKDHKQASGKLGYFQHSFKVYGRDGEKCMACESIIEKMNQSGRSTFYCPTCQKV